MDLPGRMGTDGHSAERLQRLCATAWCAQLNLCTRSGVAETGVEIAAVGRPVGLGRGAVEPRSLALLAQRTTSPASRPALGGPDGLCVARAGETFCQTVCGTLRARDRLCAAPSPLAPAR